MLDVLEQIEELEKQPNAAMIDKIVDSKEDTILQIFLFHKEELFEWKEHIDDYSVFLTVYSENQTCAVKLPYHSQKTRDYIYRIGKRVWEQGHRVMVFDAYDVMEEDSTMWDGSLRKKVPVTICESIEKFESFIFAKERKANE